MYIVCWYSVCTCIWIYIVGAEVDGGSISQLAETG